MAITSRQAEREQLQQVITHLQEQRPFLGDDAVNTALKVLQEKWQVIVI